MRTLKKTLALVLVLAMMFSLCAVSASADFTDADEIKYVEAVEVLSAIGIIDGMPDGSFDATGAVTRAQAAKIITLAVGGDDYADATVASFDDVAADHWAADYIGYCYEEGIIAGYGDGKFGPSDPVTGYQLAKMLLVALGSDEDYTGAAWQIAVAKDAADYGIFAGNAKADKTAAATREETCLYTLNAMTISVSGKVTYAVDGSDIIFTDLTTALLAADGDVTKVTKVTPTDTLLNKNYKVTVTRDADAYGRPGNQYDGKILGTYGLFFADAPVATFTGAVTEKEIFDVIGSKGVTAKFADIYEDGTYAYWGLATEYHKTTAAAGMTAPFTGAGIATEIYVDALGNYTLVAVRDYLAKVTSVVPADAATETDRKIVVTLQGEAAPAEAAGMVCEGYTTEEFAKGDYVIVNVAEAAGKLYVTDIAAAESISGKVTKNVNNITFTVGDAEYVLSQNASNAAKAIAVGDEGSWYVDSYGNIIGVKSAAIVPVHYGYLVDYATSDYNDSNLLGTGATAAAEKVKFVNEEGKVVILDAAFKTNALTGVVTEYVAADAGWTTGDSDILFAYTLNADGKIATIANATDTPAADDITVTKGNATVTSSALKLTDKTVFFFVDKADEVGETKDEYAVYVGYTNVPVSTTGTLAARCWNRETNVMNALVLEVGTVDTNTAAQYVYFAGAQNTVETTAAGTVVTYTNVYVNGVKSETGLKFAEAQSVNAGEVYEFVTNTTTGMSSLGEKRVADDATGTEITNLQSGYFTAGSNVYTDKDTVYYEIDMLAKTIAVAEGLPALSLDDSFSVNVLYNDKGTATTAAADVVFFYVGD